MNLTICITLCIVVFTDEDKNTDNKGEIVVEKDSSEEYGENVFNNDLDEEKSSEDVSGNDITNDSSNNLSDKNSDESTDEVVSYTPSVILDNSDSNNKKDDEETDKIVESQVQQDTTPVTYINIDGITLNNEEQTTESQETETTPIINGDTAVITQSCNIRSSTDMDNSNKIGTAQVGSYYRIAKDKCTANWTAIYLEDNSIGYVSSSFCSYN